MNIFENEFITIDKIYTVGRYESTEDSPKFMEYGTVLNTYELVIFLSGENLTKIGDIVINDTPGSVRYMSKGKINGKYTVQKKVPGTCVDIFFDTLSPMPEHALGMIPKKDLRDKAVRLHKIWQSKHSGYYVEAMMIFYDIIFNLQKESCEYLPTKQQMQMRRAYEYILENYRSHDFDYKKLCEVSGFKYTFFSELFKKAYNMTPVQAVTKMRIDYAKELLVTDRYSVSEIAGFCGFENVYYFSKVFKKQTGFSPSKYPF